MPTFVIFQLKTTHGGCFPLKKMSSWSIRQTRVQVRWSKLTFMCVWNIISLFDLNAAGGSLMSLGKVGAQRMVLWSSGGLVLQASAYEFFYIVIWKPFRYKVAPSILNVVEATGDGVFSWNLQILRHTISICYTLFKLETVGVWAPNKCMVFTWLAAQDRCRCNQSVCLPLWPGRQGIIASPVLQGLLSAADRPTAGWGLPETAAERTGANMLANYPNCWKHHNNCLFAAVSFVSFAAMWQISASF